MTTWTVREDASGWSVHRDHRQHEQGLASEDDAVDEVRRRYTPRDTVVLEERDGYRTLITRRMRRRR
jgi:hypothetical protein